MPFVSRGKDDVSTAAFAITAASAPEEDWGRMLSAREPLDNGGGYLGLTVVGGATTIEVGGYSYQQLPANSVFSLPPGKTWLAIRLPIAGSLRTTQPVTRA